ncbi:hypothetical protein ACFOY8_14645 [Thalassospira xianhensis]|uniref:Uncharacterized protein n=1 Tax=Thalassospira xianhensis MCCC 1A02616 TaxID=1177929 RepID=A0A367UIY7_9PROT|nr:hypothetical protein [Thalassospira xianhensis]RCK07613.1 hypothetical protein TH5_00595 [Thalassospira xianhensis MCCC 1A02616]
MNWHQRIATWFSRAMVFGFPVTLGTEIATDIMARALPEDPSWSHNALWALAVATICKFALERHPWPNGLALFALPMMPAMLILAHKHILMLSDHEVVSEEYMPWLLGLFYVLAFATLTSDTWEKYSSWRKAKKLVRAKLSKVN